jgi:branched-chain amino acid transport system substrate-binding protein
MSHLRKTFGVILALAWVAAGTSFLIPPAQAADVIKFGAALPLTGPLATEGKKQRTGYELWRNLVNKQGGINVGGKKMKVEIVYYDYESKTPTATKLFERLITKDKVQFTFGPFGSGATASVAAMTERYGMPMIAPTASSAKLYARGYKYLFGLLVPNDFPADSFFQLVSSQNPKPKTMAFVTRNDFFPKVITKVFQGVSKKYGLKEVYYAQFPKDAKDMSTWLTTVKGKKPDVLMVAGYLGDLILATKQAKELKVNPKAIFMTAGPVYSQYTKALGKTAEGITTASWWADTLGYKGPVLGTPDDFSKMWMKATGDEADYVAAASSAAGVAYQLAIEKVGSLDKNKIRDALAAMDAMTFFGRIKFNKNGQNIGSIVPVIQIQGGKRLPVSPKDMAQGSYQYPKPRF